MTEARKDWSLHPPNVVLFGPPGVGKTSIGRRLAARLDRPFVDVDERIEAEAGAEVAEIFREQGEAEFRRIEARICRELARRAGLVIACGGGALLDDEARNALQETGRVICLRASEEELLARVPEGRPRPLLAGDERAGL
ncbi:MAG: shikimate kinase, partial [Anaerolineales bacterium]|nr:shikimate kinase [Anaerolineales bacterium]